MFVILAAAALFAAGARRADAVDKAPQLLIYAIDVEGGQATLLVSPEKGSLLVDTGWAGNNGRDAMRIQAAMSDAGITRIDEVLITHFHTDHVGGLPGLLARIPVGEFADHGENREDSDITRHDYEAYVKAIGGKPRHVVQPGDTIDVAGLNIVVVAADGDHIAAVPGVKPTPNSYCASEPAAEADATENARSVGILVTFGDFHFLDLGDLTKAKEVALVCPNNPLPRIDLFLATHHGMNLSNTKALVDSLGALATIMDNGAHKAGSPEAWQTIHDAPGMQALFMLHTAEGSDAAHNSSPELIANLKGAAGDGAYFKVMARCDGAFTVMNSRTRQERFFTRKQIRIITTRHPVGGAGN